MPACVSACGHADMCWFVPTCADMCRHVPACETTLSTSDTNHLISCMLACVDMCICADCADMCRHVPTCAINLDTSDSDHLDLIYMPACFHLWTCRHVLICADMCRHVPIRETPLIPTIWNLSCMLACVSTLDMPTCADLCRHVPTWANMWNHSQHLCIFETYLECWHADMCLFVPTCANMWH